MAAASSRSIKRRLLASKLSIFGLLIVLILVITGVFAPYLAPYDPNEMMFEYVYHSPSQDFLLGTDALGRDVLSRVVWGARTSLFVGIGATVVALLVGVTFGGLAGFYGKITSQVFMRLADVQLSIPSLILLIVAAAVLGERNMPVIVAIIGITMWPTLGRVTRSKVLDLKTRDYVEAAKIAGASNTRILWRHIMPNGLGPITVIATLDIGSAIIMESSLSFLGLGDPRMISWGNMLSTGLQDMIPAPWMAVFPGFAIFFTVWGLNMFGDALRDALDVEA
ncbi:MAG: ABC transporter permease [Desulfobacteraceae bacterium]|nr:ABC transporter permease [Desulfobacteraceae bacterium]